ncbi:hypothetical protein FSP39_018601 [Pinctada imbricata]|uniref:Transporter n=1 Tax=Pinctada imbricata TaxID=66713 RepID=A0AA89BKT8_PINIB|nr:hypothetical protein FSP39_018601 [Pinctada imbricata]
MTGATTPVLDGNVKMIEKPKAEPEREKWDKKIEFLLAVVGFAVDLGNVWRFPYVCFQNGGGAFLVPYLVMYIFGGLPLFFMELALGQYQRCGCLTVWRRICPGLKGIGLAIIVIACFVSWYYNVIIAWSVYYFFSVFRSDVPWKSCNNEWNSRNNCIVFDDAYRFRTDRNVYECKEYFYINETTDQNSSGNTMSSGLVTYGTTTILDIGNISLANGTCIKWNNYTRNETRQSATEEFFEREVLHMNNAQGLVDVGKINWMIALCLLAVFTIVYFAMWKGVKSSGKAVWITATMPYLVLFILLIRGCILEGAINGITYYVTPDFSKLGDSTIWVAAAAQVFFSLGPGFGVLLALSSYNKFHNNCYRDALLTSTINCVTSFLAGFAVFAVLGHMAFLRGTTKVESVSRDDVGLIFIVYPEAISTLAISPFWAGIFFFMLITLGLDTTFGGLEAICTGILDEWPILRKHRKLFVLGLITFCFVGALACTTEGGIHVVQLMDSYGAPISIIFVVFLEAIAVSWIYGKSFVGIVNCPHIQ